MTLTIEMIVVSVIVSVIYAVVGFVASKENFSKTKFLATIVFQVATTLGLGITGIGETYDASAYSAVIWYGVTKIYSSIVKKVDVKST
jgi:hypothetical protein